jgi:hypothetical protein
MRLLFKSPKESERLARTVASRADAEAAAVSNAARRLGSMPRDLIAGRRRSRRAWTGFLGRRRAWVGQAVMLPDGGLAWVKSIKRGRAIVRTGEWSQVDGAYIHRYLSASELRPALCPEAVLLGRRKRGAKERKSLAKAESSRRNGLRPVRPGSRPRGRPAKDVGQPTDVLRMARQLRLLLDQNSALLNQFARRG